MTDVVGWISSIILLVTVGKQVHKQWKEHTSEGVSKWLFLGQISASIGFTVYAILLGNPIFIFTNSLMILASLLGVVIVLRHRRRVRP
jgi:uncharacterized protein with PQ loop repeat